MRALRFLRWKPKGVLSNEIYSSLLDLVPAAHTAFTAGCWFLYAARSVIFPMGRVTWTVVTEMEKVVSNIVNSLIGHFTVLPSFILAFYHLRHKIPLIYFCTYDPQPRWRGDSFVPLPHGVEAIQNSLKYELSPCK